MAFWLNEAKEEKVTGEFELGGGNLEPIPADTTCVAFIDEAKFDSYEEDEYISLKWKILAPAEYKNRIIFQKLRVMDSDKAKAAKAQKMLLSIDFNAKGSLSKMESFDNSDLQKNLCNKPMMISLQVWEINEKKGNWIAAVKPKGGGTPDRVVPIEREYTQAEEPASNPSYDADEAELAF